MISRIPTIIHHEGEQGLVVIKFTQIVMGYSVKSQYMAIYGMYYRLYWDTPVIHRSIEGQ